MKRTNQSKGTAAVELALMIGILMLILMGTIDVARVFYSAVTVDDASRAGAQYGIRSNAFSGDVSGIELAATHNAQDLGTVTTSRELYCMCEDDSIKKNNCATVTCTEGVPQVYVRVETQRTFSTAFGYPGLPQSIPLSSATTFRVQ